MPSSHSVKMCSIKLNSIDNSKKSFIFNSKRSFAGVRSGKPVFYSEFPPPGGVCAREWW